MDSLITRTEFARQIGVTKAVLDSAWLRTAHPDPSYTSSSGRLHFYSRQEMADWWETTRSGEGKKKESPDTATRVFQVNSRFTRTERERIYAIMKPGESFSAAFRRLALLGLKRLEADVKANRVDELLMWAAQHPTAAEEKTGTTPNLRKIT